MGGGELTALTLATLQRFAYVHGCNTPDAEDVAMEAWLKLQEADLYNDHALKTYAYLTVRNLCADRARRRGRQRTTSLEDEAAEPVCGGAPVYAELETRELRSTVRRVVRGLPSVHRDVVEAHYFENQDVLTIARRHGVPEGTVKSRLHRARESMARRLKEWK